MQTYSMNNIVNSHKGYYFSPSTMRFFKSRLPQWAFCKGDTETAKAFYFVTTERGPGMPRLATVRRYDVEKDSIDTVGEFQQYTRRAAAERALIRLLEA